MNLKIITIIIATLLLFLPQNIFAKNSEKNMGFELNGSTTSVYEVSSYMHELGTSSSILYGAGSGYSAFANIFTAYCFAGDDMKSELLIVAPTSSVYITFGALNLFVKKQRRDKLLELGVENMESEKIINIGIILYSTSIVTNFLNCISYASENRSLIKGAAVINASVLTLSFAVNLIAKVKQGIELNTVARKKFDEKKRASIYPYVSEADSHVQIGFLILF